MTTAELCTKVIKAKKFKTKESMISKLDIYLLHDRISNDEYKVLYDMVMNTVLP